MRYSQNVITVFRTGNVDVEEGVYLSPTSGSSTVNVEENVEECNTRVYPKVSGLATWSENCKWYSSLPLGADMSLFCESV
jgi:hypothetical protein